MSRPRVVVTGVGAVTPAGNTAEATWQSVLEGRSGVGPITLFDAEPFPVRIHAEVKDFEIDERIDAKQRRHMNRGVRFAMNSVLEALDDSGLEITEENSEDVGIIFGNGGGGYDEMWAGQQTLDNRGPRRVSPFLVANFIVDAASGHISIHTGARGPNVAVVSACATGAAAIGAGMQAIHRGDAAAVIAGSCESVLVPLFHATWCSMRALASDNENPASAVKPFDLNRGRLRRRRGRGNGHPRGVRARKGARGAHLLRGARVGHLERRLRHDRPRRGGARPAALDRGRAAGGPHRGRRNRLHQSPRQRPRS